MLNGSRDKPSSKINSMIYVIDSNIDIETLSVTVPAAQQHVVTWLECYRHLAALGVVLHLLHLPNGLTLGAIVVLPPALSLSQRTHLQVCSSKKQKCWMKVAMLLYHVQYHQLYLTVSRHARSPGNRNSLAMSCRTHLIPVMKKAALPRKSNAKILVSIS